MESASRGVESESNWLARGTLFAAACGFLIALGTGVDYVRASSTEYVAQVFSWLPKLALLVMNLAVQAFYDAGSTDTMFHWVTTRTASSVVVGIALTLGLLLRRRATK